MAGDYPVLATCRTNLFASCFVPELLTRLPVAADFFVLAVVTTCFQQE